MFAARAKRSARLVAENLERGCVGGWGGKNVAWERTNSGAAAARYGLRDCARRARTSMAFVDACQ